MLFPISRGGRTFALVSERESQCYRKCEALLRRRSMEGRDIGVHVEDEENPDVTVLREVIKRWGRNPVLDLDA